jgi:Mg2+-importing ATPase
MAIATDKVDEINIQSPQKWDLKFIRRFMIIFGLLSSVFDYFTFGVLIFIMHANEKTFQTGWFTESVISAILIVLVVRTKLSFFKSPPSLLLSVATVLVLLFVLVLPLLPLSGWLGFTRLPLAYYGWMFCIVVMYLFSAELAKKWFYRHMEKSRRK